MGRIIRFETFLFQVVERQKPVLPGAASGIGTQVIFPHVAQISKGVEKNKEMEKNTTWRYPGGTGGGDYNVFIKESNF
jgi:hypothetical protein